MIIPLIVGGGLSEIQQVLAMLDSWLLLIPYCCCYGRDGDVCPSLFQFIFKRGKNFLISKVIPVAPGVQIMGKILLFVITDKLTGRTVGRYSAGFFWYPWVCRNCCYPWDWASSWRFPITISLLIDFIRLYLTWDDPQRAIKQNMNVLFGMIAASILLYGIYLGVQMAIRWGCRGDRTIILAVAAAGLILGAILMWLCCGSLRISLAA